MRREVQNFWWVLCANFIALSIFCAWACIVPAPKKTPEITQADRDCAAQFAVFVTLQKAGTACDEALALARLAGSACKISLRCVDAAPISTPKDLDGGVQ